MNIYKNIRFPNTRRPALVAKTINKYQKGGKNTYSPSTLAGWVTQLITGDDTKSAYADITSSTVNAGADAVPVVGNAVGMAVSIGDAVYDLGKLIENPSWEQLGNLGTSVAGIVPGIGNMKDAKNAVRAAKQVVGNTGVANKGNKIKAVQKSITRKGKSTHVRVNKLSPDLKVTKSWGTDFPKYTLPKLGLQGVGYYDFIQDTISPISWLTTQ